MTCRTAFLMLQNHPFYLLVDSGWIQVDSDPALSPRLLSRLQILASELDELTDGKLMVLTYFSFLYWQSWSSTFTSFLIVFLVFCFFFQVHAFLLKIFRLLPYNCSRITVMNAAGSMGSLAKYMSKYILRSMLRRRCLHLHHSELLTV